MNTVKMSLVNDSLVWHERNEMDKVDCSRFWDLDESILMYQEIENFLQESMIDEASTSSSGIAKKRSLSEISSNSVEESRDDLSSEEKATHIPVFRKGTPKKSFPLPKIIKNDLRRKYTIMFSNVLNSMDFTLLDSFFRKFFVPSAALVKTEHQHSRSCAVDLSGTDHLIAYFGLLSILSPDSITRFDQVKIRQRVNTSTTEIIANFHVTCTQFYDAPLSKIADWVTTSFTSAKQSVELSSILVEGSKRGNKRAKKLNVSQYTSYRETQVALQEDVYYQQYLSQFDPFASISSPKNWQNDFPLLEKPYLFIVEGILSLQINDQKRIEGITMVPLKTHTSDLSS